MVFARKSRILQFRTLFVALVVLCCVGLLLTYYNRADIKQCFAKPTAAELEMQVNLPILLEDVLALPPQPNSIFFHETTCRLPESDSIFSIIRPKPLRLNLVNLTARAACAIESAALHNPNLEIYVFFASPSYWDNDTANAAAHAILSYPNVHFRNLDLWSYAAGTPIEKWFNTDELFRSSFVLSHISDFLRYLTLWRYGGTYLDMDVVVLRSLEDLPPNYTGAESLTSLAAGVMNFANDGIGRKVANYCLHDFMQHFNGQDWGNNGPGVITRTLKHICQASTISEMFDKERCLGFQVYKREAFYAVPWREWAKFFDEVATKTTLNAVQNSYVAHVWNKHSKKRKHHIGDRGAYGELAAQHCPKVLATVNEYF